MSPAGVLAGGWLALGLALAWRWRPMPSPLIDRLARVTTGAGVGPGAAGETGGRGARFDRAAAEPLGRLVLRALGQPPGDARRVGRAVVAGLVTLAVSTAAAPAVAALVWAMPALVARRRRAAEERSLVATLPEVVDLFVLAASAGLTLALGVPAVARRSPEPLASALGRADRQAAAGRPLADCLDEVVGQLGDAVRPLVGVLVAGERYGTPTLERLLTLADEVRADRRRRAEEAARRVPVTLLFPLVLCILPAFGLLTVAPLLAGSFRSLGN